MRQPLTIAAAQPLCHQHDVAANALEHAAAVRAAGTRVVLFPELWQVINDLTRLDWPGY